LERSTGLWARLPKEYIVSSELESASIRVRATRRLPRTVCPSCGREVTRGRLPCTPAEADRAEQMCREASGVDSILARADKEVAAVAFEDWLRLREQLSHALPGRGWAIHPGAHLDPLPVDMVLARAKELPSVLDLGIGVLCLRRAARDIVVSAGVPDYRLCSFKLNTFTANEAVSEELWELIPWSPVLAKNWNVARYTCATCGIARNFPDPMRLPMVDRASWNGDRVCAFGGNSDICVYETEIKDCLTSLSAGALKFAPMSLG
jgi:hypothetical protein